MSTQREILIGVSMKQMPEHLWRAAKAAAAGSGKTLTTWLCEAIRAKLDDEKPTT